jgi:hypothetical protein
VVEGATVVLALVVVDVVELVVVELLPLSLPHAAVSVARAIAAANPAATGKQR